MMASATTPLLTNSSLLENCFSAISEGKRGLDTQCQKVSRRVSYAIAGGFSSVAKIFYIPISLQAGVRILGKGGWGTALGVTSAVCNCKAFLILELWAARGIIKDLLGSKLEENTALERKKVHSCITGGLLISALLIAIFTQIPYALPADDYAPEYKTFAGIFSLIASIFIPTRSTQLSLKKIAEKSSSVNENSTISKIQTGVVQSIREKKQAFDNTTWDTKKHIVTDLSQIKSNIADKVHSYFKWLISPSPNLTSLNSAIGKNASRISKALGLCITGVFEYAIAKYSYEKLKELVWDNEYFAVTAAGLTALSCLYLYGKAIFGTSERVCHSVQKKIEGKKNPSLGEQLWPRLSTGLKIEEAISNIFALGPTFVIWGDFFKNPTWQHWFFMSVLAIAIYFIISTSSFDTIDDFLKELPLTDEQRAVLRQSQEFESLASAFENCPQEEFASFLQRLPEETKALLCTKVGISEEEMNVNIRQALSKNSQLTNDEIFYL